MKPRLILVAPNAYAVYRGATPEGVVHRVQRYRTRHAWMLDGRSQQVYSSSASAVRALCERVGEATAEVTE